MNISDLLFSIVLLSAAFLAGLIVCAIISFLISRWDKFISSRKIKIKLACLKKPLLFLIPVTCVLAIIPFTHLSEEAAPIIVHALSLCLIASCGWLFIKAVYMLRETILSQYDFKARDNLKARMVYTQTRVIANIITAGIMLSAVSFMLMTFSAVRQVGVSILASAGILGVILGFAAQKTLGNIIAGIQIAIAQPIGLDDAVVVENE